MKDSKFKNLKKWICPIGVFLFVVLAFYFFLFKEFNPIFGINDDWTIYMVLSGSYLGEPESYVLFILYPMAWFICKLYELTTEVPWYGLLLHGCFILSGFWLFIRCYTRCKTKKWLVAVSALSVFLISNIRILLTIQFTHAAAVCGAAAIFCFVTADTKDADWKKYLWANIPTILMAALSLCIRQDAAYMCLPVAGMLFLARWFTEDKKINTDIVKKYAGFVIALFAVLGSLLLIHKIAYSNELWSEYANINKYRSKIADFYGSVSYEEMKDVTEEIGMTEEEYYLCHNMLPFYNGEIPYSEFLKIIVERAKEKYDLAHPFEVRLQESNEKIVGYLSDKNVAPQNYVYILLFMALCNWLLGRKQWKGFLFVAAYLFGRFFAWYYILFNGRFPIRIPQGLFAIDILAVLAIFIYCMNETEGKKERIKGFDVLMGVAAVSSVLLIFYRTYEPLKAELSYVSIYQDRWYGVKEYCMEHPENMYLLNNGSQTLYYFSDNVLDTHTIGKMQNYYSLSNFYSMSPNGFKKTNTPAGGDMAEELLKQGNNYLICEKGCFNENDVYLQYYKNHYPTFRCELVDTFETQTTTFEVYHMRK